MSNLVIVLLAVVVFNHYGIEVSDDMGKSILVLAAVGDLFRAAKFIFKG